MIKDFILPDIGEGVVECELVDWMVKEGDVIVEDQPIADVMTDKALVQIPAPHGGVVTKLYYAKGEIAKVHEPLYAVDIEATSAEQTKHSSSQINDDQVSTEQLNVEISSTTDSVTVSGKAVEEFLLPDIGEGIVECELVEWLVEEGIKSLKINPSPMS